MQFKRLWIALGIVLIASFGVLGGVGYKGIKSAPPIPQKLVTTDGQVLFAGSAVMDGQNVWQSLGGQEIGSIWGHGAYVAPDWTADYLHRECEVILNRWAQEDGVSDYASLSVEEQAALRARLEQTIRHNTYDAETGTITITPVQAIAYKQLAAYYAGVFQNGRSDYAIPQAALTDSTKQEQMAAFFWWTAWAASTNRPGQSVTYTQNWPHEEHSLAIDRPATPLCGA